MIFLGKISEFSLSLLRESGRPAIGVADCPGPGPSASLSAFLGGSSRADATRRGCRSSRSPTVGWSRSGSPGAGAPRRR